MSLAWVVGIVEEVGVGLVTNMSVGSLAVAAVIVVVVAAAAAAVEEEVTGQGACKVAEAATQDGQCLMHRPKKPIVVTGNKYASSKPHK